MAVPKQDRITKRRIATVQLCRAIKLIKGNSPDFDPISALTLAGAAEEILGQMVKAKGLDTALDESVQFGGQFWEIAIKIAAGKGMHAKPPNEKEVRSRHNRVRNELKHNDGGKNRYVITDIVYEAEDMIFRALRNYEKLYNKLPPDKEVRDWYDWATL